MMVWSAQEARRSFAEVLRRAHDEGEQIVTKNGHEVAVVLDIEDYRRMRRPARSFTQHLLSIPTYDDAWATEFDAEVARRRASGQPRSFPELTEPELTED